MVESRKLKQIRHYLQNACLTLVLSSGYKAFRIMLNIDNFAFFNQLVYYLAII